MAASGTSGSPKQTREGEDVTSTPAASDAQPVKQDAENATEPSGYKGDNPSTAGPGATAVVSKTPENKEAALNPSAAENPNTTPVASKAEITT